MGLQGWGGGGRRHAGTGVNHKIIAVPPTSPQPLLQHKHLPPAHPRVSSASFSAGSPPSTSTQWPLKPRWGTSVRQKSLIPAYG